MSRLWKAAAAGWVRPARRERQLQNKPGTTLRVVPGLLVGGWLDCQPAGCIAPLTGAGFRSSRRWGSGGLHRPEQREQVELDQPVLDRVGDIDIALPIQPEAPRKFERGHR